MNLRILAPLLVLAACSKPDDKPSCADRAAALTRHLAAPRSFDDLRAASSVKVQKILDHAVTEAATGGRATYLAKELEGLVVPCADIVRVFGETAGVPDKAAHLKAHAGPAFEACKCVAGPEDAGAVLEAMLAEWNR